MNAFVAAFLMLTLTVFYIGYAQETSIMTTAEETSTSSAQRTTCVCFEETTSPIEQETTTPQEQETTTGEEETTTNMTSTESPGNMTGTGGQGCTPQNLCSSYNGTFTLNGCYFFCRRSNFQNILSGTLIDGEMCRYQFWSSNGTCRNGACFMNSSNNSTG